MKAPLLADPRLWGWLAIALAIGGLLYAVTPLLVALRHLRTAHVAGPLYGGPK